MLSGGLGGEIAGSVVLGGAIGLIATHGGGHERQKGVNVVVVDHCQAIFLR